VTRFDGLRARPGGSTNVKAICRLSPVVIVNEITEEREAFPSPIKNQGEDVGIIEAKECSLFAHPAAGTIGQLP
jgi:hypothetical protein